MIDWSLILNQLRAKYVHNQSIKSDGTRRGMKAIAYVVGSDDVTLNRLARGEVKEPKYSVGVKILELHKKVCKNEN